MEKSFEEVLVQFYVDQYRENAKRSTGKPVKLAHYIHRLNNKAKSIKYARFSKNETIALDKLHQEIKRLALITYYSNNKNARQILNREILPQLVRVDMEQFDENEAEYLTEDFLKLLRKEYIGAICTRSMKALYNEYRSKELRREIVTLVPARPELEFPKAVASRLHQLMCYLIGEHDPYALKLLKIAKHCRFPGTYTTCYSYKNHTISFSVINAHHTSHSHTRCPPPWIPSCPPRHAFLSPEA